MDETRSTRIDLLLYELEIIDPNGECSRTLFFSKQDAEKDAAKIVASIQSGHEERLKNGILTPTLIAEDINGIDGLIDDLKELKAAILRVEQWLEAPKYSIVPKEISFGGLTNESLASMLEAAVNTRQSSIDFKKQAELLRSSAKAIAHTIWQTLINEYRSSIAQLPFICKTYSWDLTNPAQFSEFESFGGDAPEQFLADMLRGEYEFDEDFLDWLSSANNSAMLEMDRLLSRISESLVNSTMKPRQILFELLVGDEFEPW